MGEAEQGDLLVQQIRPFVGAPAAGSHRGRDPVNQPMVNHWCQAFGDTNPVYVDPQVAAETRHEGVVAPPAMLGTWTLDAVDRRDGGPRDQVLRRLEDAGYVAVVATNYEQTYHREMRPGDVLSESISVEALSERKTTSLGEGYFVTVRHDYRDDAGELVGTARMRLLKYRPPLRPPASPESATAAAPRRPRAVITEDNAFFWEGVSQGQLLIQRCPRCELLRHPPRPMCAGCGSTEWDTVPASAQGTIYSYAVHHHPPLPAVQTPHTIVLVELEDGVRFVTQLASGADRNVAIGDAVRIEFDEIDEELTLPVARPVPRDDRQESR